MKGVFAFEADAATALTDFKNPFQKGSIEKVWINIRRKNYSPGGDIVFEASISFKNGDTKGEQDIKGETFSDLIGKINAFIKSLD